MRLWQSMRDTTAVVTIYLLIFTVVLKTNELSNPPEPDNQLGLNLSTAWQDLHVITTRPHPFNSHANDIVHAYLLERLNPIAAAYSHVHVDDDRVSNASYEHVYFEGTNILVKVDGTAEDFPGAVLFSAHYDSVSTASGATDDGIAIVSMLQMVEKLAKTRSKRTAIFNFNNGEEDGLNGAHAFLEHPWYNLTRTFLNLEGAGSGSRPILFRGTSTKPLRAFRHVSHPHGTILASDVFSRGAIRSRTDYSIYAEGGGMQGLDLAFYRGRGFSHTKYDAIPFLQGGTRALWSMMEVLDTAGRALLDQDNSEPAGDVVYFDLFGRIMVMFPLAAMQIVNIILLVTVPVTTAGLFVWRRLAVTQTGPAGILHRRWWNGKPKLDWIRFWIGLVVVVVSQAGFVLIHLKSNKNVVYSLPYVVTGSAVSLVYMTFSLVASSSFPSLRGCPLSTPNPNTSLLQLLVFHYLILLYTTLVPPIGGTYPFTAFAACTFLGWLVGSVDGVLQMHGQEHRNETSMIDEPREDQQPTESTPLIRHLSSGINAEGDGHQRAIWLIQLLLVVPIPVILVSHIGVIFLGAMPQGIVDGGPVWTVYAGISLIATLLILPLAPFIASYPRSMPFPLAHPFQLANSQKNLFRVVLVVFTISVAYTSGLLGVLFSPTSIRSTRHGFPFSINLPMKVFFQQKVEIVAPWSTQEVVNTTNVKFKTRSRTYLTGLPHYLEKMIVPALPSAVNSKVDCMRDGDRKELFECSWSSGDAMLPSPGKNTSFRRYSADIAQHAQVLIRNPWLQSRIQILSSNARRIWIQGTNTRACRVYFDNAKVAKWSVVGGGSAVQKGYEGFEKQMGEEMKELRVWSRTWDREFVIDVIFVEPPQKVQGRVACGWSEYESGRVGLNDGIESKIPAYEEALKFFPRWATLTKLTDGLVEVWSAFEV